MYIICLAQLAVGDSSSILQIFPDRIDKEKNEHFVKRICSIKSTMFVNPLFNTQLSVREKPLPKSIDNCDFYWKLKERILMTLQTFSPNYFS